MIHAVFFFLLCSIVAVLAPGSFLSIYATIRSILDESMITHTQKKWHGLCEEYGASTVEDFYRHVSNDAALQRYYHDFDWSNARIIVAKVDFYAHVAYTPLVSTLHGGFPWSRKPVLLRKGESFITDRTHVWDESSGWLVRSWCCNPVSVIRPLHSTEDWYEPPAIYLPPTGLQTVTMHQASPGIIPPHESHRTPPRFLTTTMFNHPPHTFHVSNPPDDTCVFRPDVVLPFCLPASFPEKDRIACGKDGKPFHIPACETMPIPETSGLERVVLPTPEPSTWILFGSGIALVVVIRMRMKK